MESTANGQIPLTSSLNDTIDGHWIDTHTDWQHGEDSKPDKP